MSADEAASGSAGGEGLFASSLRPNLYVLILGSGAAAALSFCFLPPAPAIASTLLGVLMIAGADVDSRTFLLPDVVTVGATGSGIFIAPFLSDQERWSSVSGAALRAIAVGAILLSLRAAYYRLRGREGLGLGDIKLGAAIGAWLPFELIPTCFTLAAAGALMTVLVAKRKRALENVKLPFGAFLCPALWLVFFVNALPS
jgi:leader peptidase (prepilin peptidase) / N-methyltransferase